MKFNYTGLNLSKLVVNVAQCLNLKSDINVDKIFLKSIKQLYQQAYKYHTELYNKKMLDYINKEEPYNVQYLLESFETSQKFVVSSYDKLNLN